MIQLNLLISIFLSFGLSLAQEESTLVSVIQLYRHGQRTPVDFYANDPYQAFSYWNLTEGQLTNVGKQQHFALGQFIRKRYNGFLSEKYFRNEFFVQTTNMDRTFMSAASDIAGLFPPVEYQIWNPDLLWQAIPVFPVEPAILSPYDVCTKYANALSEFISTDEYFGALAEEYAYLVDYLNEYSGANYTSFFSAIGIWDTLYIESLQNFTLPSWTEAIFPQPVTDLIGIYYTSFAANQVLKRLTGGAFLHEVIDRFERYLANDTTTQKYLQFSGHDINIAAILSTLGAFTPHVPPFASTLLFELREKNATNYINIYYKRYEEPEPITLAGCAFDCTLADFKSILSNVTITVAEWYIECDSEESTASESIIRPLRLRSRGSRVGRGKRN